IFQEAQNNQVDFADLLDSNASKGSIAVACLNSESAAYPIDLLLQLKNRIAYLALVDGACNLFYDNQMLCKEFEPQLVTGDFDSVRPEVLQYYKDLPSTEVIPTPDQDRTDFDKCLSCLLDSQRLNLNKEIACILVLGGLGGRVDHTFGNLHTLVKWSSQCKPRIYFATQHDLWVCLPPCQESVECRLLRPRQGKYAGLIPLDQPCLNVYTSGLKWNLAGDTLSFTGLVSTSNEAVDELIIARWSGGHLLITVTYELT
uniref:Thiamine diphosphokinase n=2 Tax=Macrostomum lignano TaxID=282301 RepID=A0A1I8JJF6_9PLAT